ncbi:Aste57867_10467 [Aphanomyces stellatus]|uniref:Aste57867_10467 protein n=1 Tax=Aphanomyces stellatus TaxID=120398 RepID=A0A485KR36_9STRA|nr:hypothetical protein As57867_010427 [Aphanomyces stellatus]VFT87341.1 Aste57867_10467 [Aphanomyces stellatus]
MATFGLGFDGTGRMEMKAEPAVAITSEQAAAKIQEIKTQMKAERRMRKRAYIRRFMQTYRTRGKAEFNDLKAQADALEDELETLLERKRTRETVQVYAHAPSTSSALPWREIAAALLEHRRLALTEHAELTHESRDVSVLVQTMQAWVASMISIPASPQPHRPVWRRASLVAHHASRTLGKEWIADLMYHNTSAVFEEYEFPAFDVSVNDINMRETRDDAALCVELRHQSTIVATSIDAIMAVYRRHLCTMLMVDGLGSSMPIETVVESTPTTSLHHMCTSHGEHIHLLYGEFRARDRHVFVVQQIDHDEALEASKTRRQRHRRSWFEFCRVGDDGQWVFRSLYVVSQSYWQDGTYLALEEDAMDWCVDLHGMPEERREARYRQAGLSHTATLYEHSYERFAELLAGMRLDDKPNENMQDE